MNTAKYLGIFALFLGFTVVEASAQSVNLSNRFSFAFKSRAEKKPPLKVGSFNARFAATVGGGYDDNPFEDDPIVTGGAFAHVGASGSLTSDWDRHLVRIAARGFGDFFPSVDGADEVFANASGFTRLDLAENTKLEARSFYVLDRDPTDDKNIPTNPVRNPKEQIYGSGLFLTQAFGDFALTGRTLYVRVFDEDVPNNGGGIIPRNNKDHARYEFGSRLSYRQSEDLSFFGEGTYYFRDYDRDIDSNGISRGSDGFYAAAGTAFSLGENIYSEAAIGVLHINAADARFGDRTTLTFDGFLTWAVTPDFNLTFVADTSLRSSQFLHALA